MCIELVDDESSAMSCGLDADGVVDGDIINDEGIWDKTFVDVKFLNIAKMESALDTFGLMRRIFRRPTSLMVNSEPDNDSQPWFEPDPCGERGFALGVGGTELGRGINSVDDPTGKLSDLRFDVLYKEKRNKPKTKLNFHYSNELILILNSKN